MEARSSEFYLIAHAGIPAFTQANSSLCALTLTKTSQMKYVFACLEIVKFALCLTLLISLSDCICFLVLKLWPYTSFVRYEKLT